MKKLIIFLLVATTFSFPAHALYSTQKNAAYIAILKAVTDFKINDEENLKQIEELRENKKFNNDLRKMLDKLSNQKNKDSANAKIYNILLKAGKDIYNELY